MSNIEEIYQGEYVHVDLERVRQVQIGTNIYSLSEAKEIAAELLDALHWCKSLPHYSNEDQKS